MRKSFDSTFMRYSVVGVFVACLDLSLYALLSTGWGVWYLSAHTLSRAAGGATGFVLNRRWTFAARGRRELPAQLLKFLITYLLSYVASSWLLYLFVEQLRIQTVTAKMGAEGTMFLFNFVSLRYWAFQRRLQFGEPQSAPCLSPLTVTTDRWRSGDE
jgi:putative flippase GtrA